MAAPLAIRTARLDERPALIELQRRASLMWEEDRQALLDHPEVIDIPESQFAEGRVFVCERDGAVLGLGVVLPRDDGAAELDGLFVEPDVWGQGVGRRLVEHGADMARAAGAVSLNVVGNKRALGFYLGCGFQALGEVATQFSPGVAMIRPL